MADVLSAIVSRIRDSGGAVPLVADYDRHERVWNPPAPLLFQRRLRVENRPITEGAIRGMLKDALAQSGITEASGQPLVFRPHDLRRLFITDAVMNGMPPHIAQLVVGHKDINTTMHYKAVYPEEVINGHRAFIARRRTLRPAGEYRQPTDEEWEEFLGHSNAAASPWEPAAGPIRQAVFTSTAVCGAPCSVWTPSSGPESWRSATTCSPASTKPAARAGSAKPKASMSAWPPRTPNSPRLTG